MHNELFYKYSEADNFAQRLFNIVTTCVYIHEVRKLADYNHAKFIVSLDEELITPADTVYQVIKVFRK